jgi:hypothetical protein
VSLSAKWCFLLRDMNKSPVVRRRPRAGKACPARRDYPSDAVFWFSAWFLGAASYRVLRAKLVPLPAGLLGAGLISAGMALRLLNAAALEADTTIAAGFALVVACRPMVEFRLAPRLSGWTAGFSYTLTPSTPRLYTSPPPYFKSSDFQPTKVRRVGCSLWNLGSPARCVFWPLSSSRSFPSEKPGKSVPP